MPRRFFRGVSVVVVIAAVAMLTPVTWWGSRPVPRAPLPNPNGYDDFMKAAGAMTGNTANADILNYEELRPLILTNAETFRLFRLGLTHPCAVPIEIALTNIPAMMNDLPYQQALCKLVAAEGRLAELENRPVDAARSYVDAMRFGNEISRGGFMMNRLIGIANGSIGLTPLINLAPKLTCEQAGPLIAELEKLDDEMVRWDEVIQNEKVLMRYQLPKRANPIIRIKAWWLARPAMKEFVKKDRLLTARLRLLTVELALRCYRSGQGSGPERLEQLVPKYLKCVPMDPFSGRPLIYKFQGTNWLLYCTGVDGKDDGGKPVGRSMSGSVSQGDLFFDSPQ